MGVLFCDIDTERSYVCVAGGGGGTKGRGVFFVGKGVSGDCVWGGGGGGADKVPWICFSIVSGGGMYMYIRGKDMRGLFNVKGRERHWGWDDIMF